MNRRKIATSPAKIDQPPEVRAVIDLVCAALPNVRWTRYQPYNQTIDDRIWDFWLDGLDGDVQLEPGFQNIQFDLSTDKHPDRASANCPEDAARIICEWLATPGGAPESFWYSRLSANCENGESDSH